MTRNRSSSTFWISLIFCINTFSFLLSRYKLPLEISQLHDSGESVHNRRNLRSSKAKVQPSTKIKQLETKINFHVASQTRSIAFINASVEELLWETATYLNELVENDVHLLGENATNMMEGHSSQYFAELKEANGTDSIFLESAKNYSTIEGNLMEQHDAVVVTEVYINSSSILESTNNNSKLMDHVNAIADTKNTNSIILESANTISTIEGNLMQHNGDTMSEYFNNNISDTAEPTYTIEGLDTTEFLFPLEIRIFLKLKLGEAFIPNEQESTLDHYSDLFANLLVSALRNTTQVYFIDADIPSGLSKEKDSSNTGPQIHIEERPVTIYNSITPPDITQVIQSSCDDSMDDSCFIVKASIHLFTGPHVDDKLVKSSIIAALSHVLSSM